MKKSNKTLVITTAVCLLPIILSIAVYSRLPEEVAVHFNGSGSADGFLPKALAAFGLPVAFALINFISVFMRNNDPKAANASAAIKTFLNWLLPFMSVVIIPVTLFMAMGADIPLHMIIPAAAAVIIIVCGNYLPKSKQNYTVGIKLPWTLQSETNWNKTHRFAGYLWVAGGIVLIAASFFEIGVIIDIAVFGVLIVLPIIYSYFAYRNEKASA